MSEPPPAHELLKGRIVLITAAAGAGIGLATAKRCIEEGATVVISDKHERRLEETAAELGVLGIPADVTQETDVQRLFDAAVAEYGRIDVAVNNAGLGGTANIIDMTDVQWNIVLDVTLNGTFRCTRAALRHMVPRGSGVIVNISSVLGWRAQAGQAHYAAAKAGVNAVAPSLAMHPFLEKVMDPGELEHLVTLEAFGRSAETWEVANVIVFLASDYSSYMTGEIVSVSSQHP